MFSVYAYYTANDTIPNQENLVYLKTQLNDGTEYREVAYPLLDEVVNSSPEVIAGTHLHSWGNILLDHENDEFQHRTD